MRDGLEIYGAENIRSGDVILSNHAGTLGQHLNNVVMYTPVHAGPDNKIIAFFCVLMHWIDIGGMMVGSCSSTVATEIFQEGLHLRTLRVVEQGRRNEEQFRVIRYNTRFPEMLMGDIDAQLGGCEMGRQLVADLAARYGVDAFEASVRQMWDHSEALVRAALAQAKPGEYEAFSFLDNDGIVPTEGVAGGNGSSMFPVVDSHVFQGEVDHSGYFRNHDAVKIMRDWLSA